MWGSTPEREEAPEPVSFREQLRDSAAPLILLAIAFAGLLTMFVFFASHAGAARGGCGSEFQAPASRPAVPSASVCASPTGRP